LTTLTTVDVVMGRSSSRGHCRDIRIVLRYKAKGSLCAEKQIDLFSIFDSILTRDKPTDTGPQHTPRICVALASRGKKKLYGHYAPLTNIGISSDCCSRQDEVNLVYWKRSGAAGERAVYMQTHV